MTAQSDEVLAALGRGWSVFPCVPRAKVPASQHGVLDACCDAGRILAYWERVPTANIGLATGKSGLVVVDVDVKDDAGGMESWRELLAQCGREIGDTPTVETPTGGLHVYYLANGAQIAPSVGKLGKGLDVRAGESYVLAAGSIHPNGGEYHWAMGARPEDVPILAFPPVLAERLHNGHHAEPVIGPIEKGRRNDALFSLAGTMRRRAFSVEAIEAALRVENARCSPPLPDDEIRKIAASSGRYAPAAEPRNRTDLGNAGRFAERHADNVRYCYPWGRWLQWDGRRWAQDQTGEVPKLAKLTVRSIYAESASIEDEDERKAWGKWALASEFQSRIEAMLALAQSEPGIAVLPDALDSHPWLLNVRNGTLDLRTGQLKAHTPSDQLTALVPLEYHPEAECPTWRDFEREISNGDDALVTHKQRAFGYALTGCTSEQCLFVLYGTGQNGKSTELNTIRTLLGSDYALHTPTETLLINDRGGGVPNDVARLRGARYVTAIESEQGRRLAEALIKQMTGGDPIAARFMRAEWFEFMPTHKLFLAVNHKPIIRGTDLAIWRRIRLWPYTVTIPPEKQDKKLPEKLLAEAEGILAWLVKGCLEWQHEGLGVPASVTKATGDYRTEMDVLGAFVADLCLETPMATAFAKDLYVAYTGWCEANGEKPITKTAFGLRLQERGHRPWRDMNARGWQGIGLLSKTPAVQTPMTATDESDEIQF
jgi:putative DNA primase/helicase